MTKSKTVLTPLLRPAVVGVFVGMLALGACAPRIDTRGNQVHAEDIATIEAGQSTRNQIMERFGAPSSRGHYGVETWYYISEVTETTAFFAPEVKDRQIIAIEFDAAGLVASVKTLDNTSAETVELAPGETPTAGNTLNFIEQILSNLGRFNNK